MTAERPARGMARLAASRGLQGWELVSLGGRSLKDIPLQEPAPAAWGRRTSGRLSGGLNPRLGLRNPRFQLRVWIWEVRLVGRLELL